MIWRLVVELHPGETVGDKERMEFFLEEQEKHSNGSKTGGKVAAIRNIFDIAMAASRRKNGNGK